MHMIKSLMQCNNKNFPMKKLSVCGEASNAMIVQTVVFWVVTLCILVGT
jgi:predicted nucleic-acid-binding Zn-ribbon protein